MTVMHDDLAMPKHKYHGLELKQKLVDHVAAGNSVLQSVRKFDVPYRPPNAGIVSTEAEHYRSPTEVGPIAQSGRCDAPNASQKVSSRSQSDPQGASD
ncbi:hypothetical protein WR25_21830 [Diploscapter pachys]|uniref:Uncharacterized protein n=1 Tax=Diploscapter pachys TaxID=2018661 RepID=A0A2A2LHT7_9BILA|nr:hypothetical protein WR25_21830 [Diploscapter pachys]